MIILNCLFNVFNFLLKLNSSTYLQPKANFNSNSDRYLVYNMFHRYVIFWVSPFLILVLLYIYIGYVLSIVYTVKFGCGLFVILSLTNSYTHITICNNETFYILSCLNSNVHTKLNWVYLLYTYIPNSTTRTADTYCTRTFQTVQHELLTLIVHEHSKQYNTNC